MLRICLFILLLLVLASPTQAVTNPLEATNNKFGIHIIDENDLEDAAKLVNSTGGDWGYVKLVIREDDRKKEKWQPIFDRMRKLHLIPIIRIATKTEKDYWVKPRVEDIGSWVDFLNSLHWVTQNRYVVIFNEPNHAKEWGNTVDPAEYAWFLREFAMRLKEKSTDFFILPAGLDASAPNSTLTMDELAFINQMASSIPNIFEYVDGWSSHSYPNPDFSGSEYAVGRGTVRTYQWERSVLARFGKSHLPIFILETGWKHSEGVTVQPNYTTPAEAANRIVYSYSHVWTDPQLVAVVPFLLNYQAPPFDQFSMKKVNSTEFHPVYTELTKLPKTDGAPPQKHNISFLTTLPTSLVKNSDYTLEVELENHGQSILGSQEGWRLQLTDLPRTPVFEIISGNIGQAEPFKKSRASIHLKTPDQIGVFTYRLVLTKDETKVVETDGTLTLIPPPSIALTRKYWANSVPASDETTLVIYDADNKVREEQRVVYTKGVSQVTDLYNIVPSRRYRIVITKPYYLPRQVYATLTDTQTSVTFPPLLPFDPSNDGKLGFADVLAVLRNPLDFFKRLLGFTS